jgi:hypothetical protein
LHACLPVSQQPCHQHYYKKSIDRVEDIVRQVMPHGVQPPDRIIQGMGYPRERMPVGGVEIKEGPSEQVKIKGADVGVVQNVVAVVPSKKRIPE